MCLGPQDQVLSQPSITSQNCTIRITRLQSHCSNSGIFFSYENDCSFLIKTGTWKDPLHDHKIIHLVAKATSCHWNNRSNGNLCYILPKKSLSWSLFYTNVQRIYLYPPVFNWFFPIKDIFHPLAFSFTLNKNHSMISSGLDRYWWPTVSWG